MRGKRWGLKEDGFNSFPQYVGIPEICQLKKRSWSLSWIFRFSFLAVCHSSRNILINQLSKTPMFRKISCTPLPRYLTDSRQWDERGPWSIWESAQLRNDCVLGLLLHIYDSNLLLFDSRSDQHCSSSDGGFLGLVYIWMRLGSKCRNFICNAVLRRCFRVRKFHRDHICHWFMV